MKTAKLKMVITLLQHISVICYETSVIIFHPSIKGHINGCTPSVCLSYAYELFKIGKLQKLQISRPWPWVTGWTNLRSKDQRFKVSGNKK